jgi:KDO2-lipid IV(A) lauroyltransferase
MTARTAQTAKTAGIAKRRLPPGKVIAYLLETLAVRIGLAIFRALPIDTASALGGWLGRGIGPRLGISTVAERNLRRAIPDLTSEKIASIIREMWDNLGRVMAEYPHLHEFHVYADNGRIEVVGAEHADRLRDDGMGGIFFGAHLGNWEIASLSATQMGVPLTHIYRAANNPFVDPILQRLRAPVGGTHHPKGREGARRMVESLREGGHLGMLIDQKLNDGIAVPFFGRDAMTAPAPAQLALKFGCPLVPVRIERLEGARFRITVHPAMEMPASGDRHADVAETMRRVNAILEGWIRERPGQWLWLHRRWPD